MITPDEAEEVLRERLMAAQPGETASVGTDLAAGGALLPLFDEAAWEGDTRTVATTLRSIAPSHDRVALDAYLACALTGLDSQQYQYISLLSDTINSICAAQGIELYEPRKVTDPSHHPEVDASDVFRIDRDRVVTSDLLVVLSHHPSFGAGQELDFAYNAMVPIIVIVPSDRKLSRMVSGIPGLVIQISYTEPEQLRGELARQLELIRPLLVQRKLQFAKHDVNIVGDRIRRARESAGLTRAELAAASTPEAPITEGLLAHWEEASDRESNLSLIQLREIAVLLNVTVAELVEPNLDGLYLSFVNSLLDSADQEIAARWGRYTSADRQRIVLRLIERFGIELGIDDVR